MTKKRKPLKHDESGKEITLDLHGYRVREAVSVADQVVRDAWEAGYDSVKLIHGAPDVKTRDQADAGGRGGIKVELRDRLARGDWSAHVQPDQPEGHRVEDGAVTVKLRPNPTPSKDRVSRKRLPKPRTSAHFKAMRAWAAAREAVGREHPIIAVGEELAPDLAKKCRCALVLEKVLAERLEHKRKHNPDYQNSRAYGRMLKSWERTRSYGHAALEGLRRAVCQETTQRCDQGSPPNPEDNYEPHINS